MKTVGHFKIEDGNLYGPKEYMEEQGNAKLDAILFGKDIAFNTCVQARPDIDLETHVLVALQTDFAGWRGAREIINKYKIDKKMLNSPRFKEEGK